MTSMEKKENMNVKDVKEENTMMMATVKGEFSADQIAAHRNTGGAGIGDLFVPLVFGLFILGRMFGRNRWATATAGGIVAPVLGFLTLGARWLLLELASRAQVRSIVPDLELIATLSRSLKVEGLAVFSFEPNLPVPLELRVPDLIAKT